MIDTATHVIPHCVVVVSEMEYPGNDTEGRQALQHVYTTAACTSMGLAGRPNRELHKNGVEVPQRRKWAGSNVANEQTTCKQHVPWCFVRSFLSQNMSSEITT